MEQRRFLLFIVLSMTVWIIWGQFIGPALMPDVFPKPKKPGQLGKMGERIDADLANSAADALFPSNDFVEPPITREKNPAIELPNHPSQTVLLGPADQDPGKIQKVDIEEDYFLAANLTSRGAAIDFVELTDKKTYPAFGNRGQRVKVLGNDFNTPLKTFALRSPEIDQLLQSEGLSLEQISWEVVPEADAANAERVATFRIVSPDKAWEITKRFELTKLTPSQREQKDVRKELLDGYELKLKVNIRNLTNVPRQISYTLQGPVGIPLEDPENSYKFRDIRTGFLRDDGNIDESKLSASETVKKEKNKKADLEWKRKIKYIGVDVLYFAALVLPGPDQIDSSKATVANENRARPEFSDVSVELKSHQLDVAANGEVSHEYTLFAGPKRKELMAKIPAMGVMDYGWFDTICRGMVWLLNTFHSIGLSYGLAIICLTAVVRTLLMPISKHQAANAAKMKVLQPKIMAKQKELEAKYGKNTEEYMKAAQELTKEQFGLMMSGCLPVFLQLPIFIALYRAISLSIELRMVPFLWFENLASPDALFKLPFVVPWFGWTHFNLLPCISTGLMFVSQKMTMPPPANEEQAQQQKMMSFMMIFMGAMFFRVPSGLCLYFIATNVWSMTERWLFEHLKKTPPPDGQLALAGVSATSSPGSSGKTPLSPAKGDPKPSALGGFWNRLQEAADSQYTASRQLGNSEPNRTDKKKKKR